jgi:hypothetical protein
VAVTEAVVPVCKAVAEQVVTLGQVVLVEMDILLVPPALAAVVVAVVFEPMMPL